MIRLRLDDFNYDGRSNQVPYATYRAARSYDDDKS